MRTRMSGGVRGGVGDLLPLLDCRALSITLPSHLLSGPVPVRALACGAHSRLLRPARDPAVAAALAGQVGQDNDHAATSFLLGYNSSRGVHSRRSVHSHRHVLTHLIHGLNWEHARSHVERASATVLVLSRTLVRYLTGFSLPPSCLVHGRLYPSNQAPYSCTSNAGTQPHCYGTGLAWRSR
jgi:hypothetical protein